MNSNAGVNAATGSDDYPELLDGIRARVAAELKAKGIHPELALQCGQLAAEGVRRDFGGFQVYIPSGKLWALTARDREIYAAWKPAVNEMALCKRYDITERRLRQIVEAKRAEDRAQRQGALGLDGGG